MQIGVRENIVRGTKSYPLQIFTVDAVEVPINTFYHWHDELEIIYVEKGGFCVNIDGKEYETVDGDIYFVSPDSFHSLSGGEGTHKRYYAIIFSPLLISFDNDNDIQKRIVEPLINHKIVFQPHIKKGSPAWESLYRVIGEIVKLNINEVHRLERMKTTLIFLEVFLTLWENNLYILPESENYESARIRQVISYIENNYSKDIKLKDLASISNLSERYFCSFFKLHTEMTPFEYINRVRINAAEIMLKESEESITEIALDCGFENVGYFIRRFKEKNGVTPREWRKKGKN